MTARIVLHAGMWKTGSTSIQSWLGRRNTDLRRHGVNVLKIDVDAAGGVHAAPYEKGAVDSPSIGRRWAANPEARTDLARALALRLQEHADDAATVVVSSEGLARPFWREDRAFLEALDDLASRHDVRVAYYVRPQHAALESLWRKSGFRGEPSAAEFLEQTSRRLHYAQTLTFVQGAAPRVTFVPRPFRRDLLHGSNVVADFAATFLDLPPDDDMDVWDNRGLPLDVANALRSAAPGTLWTSSRGGLGWIKRLTADLDLPESDRARLSRLVLQQACHDRFEDENQRLISALGWQTDVWVPAVVDDVGEATFERVAELWRPEANEVELALLHRGLAALHSSESNRPKA